MRLRTRKGTTLVEIMIFGVVGVMVMLVLVYGMVWAMRSDAWSEQWLDQVTTTCVLSERLRQDTETAQEIQVLPGGRSLSVQASSSGAPPRQTIYTWSGSGQALRRDDLLVGGGALSRFEVTSSGFLVVASMEMTARAPARAARLVVPLVRRRALAESAYPEWAGSPAVTREP